MPIRISGMTSGLDTDAIVSELVSAYNKKTDKYVKEQGKISWKQEAWKSLSSKTYSFRNGLDKMRFSTGYNLKTTTVSNAAKASVTASNNAVNGTQSLQINALAKTGYLTGEKIKCADNTEVKSDSTMEQLGLDANGEISVNGKRIAISKEMKVSEVVSKLQDAGVAASFDEKNQRFFVSSNESGADADFSLLGLNEAGTKALSKLGINAEPQTGIKPYDAYAGYAAKSEEELKKLFQDYDTKAATTDPLLAGYAKEYQNAEDDATKEAVLKEFQEFAKYADKVKGADASEMGYNTDAVRIYGQDAKITLNEAEFVSKSNAFSINGLTINAMALTDPNETLSITTTTDNQGIYDKIKDFLGDYNSLINSMTSAYNADKSSEYEPLTDDEKKAMSDSEVEKWEEKGKKGILRRDSTLSSLMSTLTSAMAKSYTINGKEYSLSTFGIHTLGIMNSEKNEHNAYHIDGDTDDENTSGSTDKLMAAIAEDPDGMTQFFQKLGSELYDNLSKDMSSTTLRSYGKFYNDKELDKQYNSYKKTISDWEKKVSDIEESYYKKFAAMESALTELQNKTSQLSGLLGS